MSGALELRARIREDIAAIETLRTGRYAPPWAYCADPGRSAHGEDFAVVVLRVSDEFYGAGTDTDAGTYADPDEPGGRMAAAHEEFETERWGVVLALDERWGAHRVLSTAPYEERETAGAVVPPLFAALIELGYSGDVQIWDAEGRSEGHSEGRPEGRVVGVGVGQMDKEEPVVLFAAALAPACTAD
ncbi:hypothetical protein [Streptomyces sp. NPDC057287]|uniref:hypothetical protein n=1 Tax=Streptomyces sp. NPDC057287 TaxID=3346086 RepID=UPI003639D838